MTFQLLAVICFGSAHYYVAHKQAEIKHGAMRKNTIIRDLDEWEALNAEASRNLGRSLDVIKWKPPTK